MHRASGRAVGAIAVLACLAAAAPALAAPARLHPAAPAAPGEAAKIARHWTPALMRSTLPLNASPATRLTATASFVPVTEPTTPPNAVNGRLFIYRGGKRGYCSATAINSVNRRVVLTAGHCVNSGPPEDSVWSRYLEFVPAYSGGTSPFGAFVARRNMVFAPRQWVEFGNPNFDIGAIITEPNAEGVAVADAVGGGATIATDLTRRQVFKSFGYPKRGRWMQGCQSPYVGDDHLTYRLPGPPTIAIRCHWAPGASGGGWLINEGTTINGLTSYGKELDRVHTFGPYFSSRNVGNLVAGW